MAREFVSRWAMADALADDIERAAGLEFDATPREIAERLIEAGWQFGGDGA